MNANLYNGLTLAYIGDSVYELKMRNYVLSQGFTKVNDLHLKTVHFTKGESQALVMRYMIEKEMLSSEEIDIFKRGRNSNVSKVRKHISRADYLEGTGFEALIGYLYLEKRFERIDEIVALAIQLLS